MDNASSISQHEVKNPNKVSKNFLDKNSSSSQYQSNKDYHNEYSNHQSNLNNQVNNNSDFKPFTPEQVDKSSNFRNFTRDSYSNHQERQTMAKVGESGPLLGVDSYNNPKLEHIGSPPTAPTNSNQTINTNN